MPNYYLIIQLAHVRWRQVKPQINLIPYAMGCIFQTLQTWTFLIIVGSSFSTYRNVHTSKQTQLNLNYLVEGYPRFLLFLPFPLVHFLASLVIPPGTRKVGGMQTNESLSLIAVISMSSAPSASIGMHK